MRRGIHLTVDARKSAPVWWVACLILTAVPAPCVGQSLPRHTPTVFEHPPLRYHGSDPTADHFLPATRDELPVSSLLPAVEPLPLGQFTRSTEEWDPSIEAFMAPPVPHADSGVFAIDGPYSPGVTDYKDGFFQKLGFSAAWLDRNNKRDDFGITELNSYLTVAVPMPSRDWPLLISPTFNVRLLDGPGHVELPPKLYEAYVDFLWVPRLTARWTGILGVAPGVYSDFEASSSEAFRVTGKALARFEWIPDRVQLLFGVIYANREDVSLLPGGGVIWTPSSDTRWELLFPRPKLAHRLLLAPTFEDWLYLAGEFGGNSYAIERLSGVNDSITLRDFRIYAGLERKLNGGAGYRIEIGYVAGRTIEFASALPDIDADDTVIIRLGVVF